MKQRLSPATQQHLVLTPQLRQAIRLLQLSAAELEAEVAEAVASNPLLDWQDDGIAADSAADPAAGTASPEPAAADAEPATDDRWEPDSEQWQASGAAAGLDDGGETEQPDTEESLQDHLLWQLHLGHFSPRDTRIGIALIDAIDEDGYLREDLPALATSSTEVAASAVQVLRKWSAFMAVCPGLWMEGGEPIACSPS